MYAAIDGSCAEVEYLLNNGANLNLVCNVSPQTSFVKALIDPFLYCVYIYVHCR